MSKFSRFMKANKKERANGFYAPTESLCGEDGKPVEWEFRHLTSKENDALRHTGQDRPLQRIPSCSGIVTCSASA